MATAHQLYPASRTDGMDTYQLSAIFGFAHADTQNDQVVYDGMDRADTVATAWRTCSDMAVLLTQRAKNGDPRAQDACARLSQLL